MTYTRNYSFQPLIRVQQKVEQKFLFYETNLSKGTFRNCDFSGCSLSQRNSLYKPNFEGSNLSGCSFDYAKLESVNFKDANLSGATFKNCESLKSVNFEGANLRYVDFTDINISEIKFQDAYIEKSIFSLKQRKMLEKMRQTNQKSTENLDIPNEHEEQEYLR